MPVKVTHHAEKRVKDRIGISKKLSDKIADKALVEGISHKEVTGRLKRYFDRLYLSHMNGNNIRLYNRKIFIFQNNILITILDLPHEFNSVEDKIKRKIIKKEQDIVNNNI